MHIKYYVIYQTITGAFKKMGIMLEFLSQKKGFSFDIMKFSILSSKRISLSRLYSIENVLSAELGYPVKIIKDEDYINVEFPDLCSREVHFDSAAERIKKNKSILPIALGRKENGHKDICNLHYMPHLLIAGNGNSGQLNMLENVIASITEKRKSEEVKFILADIAGNDFDRYSDSSYLHGKLIKDNKTLIESLEWVCDEIMNRYYLLADAEVRNIVEYNKKASEKLPYLVLIVKDIKDVIINCRNDFEIYIKKIAAKAMAAGIHIVLSSSVASFEIITATILNNMPARIAFRTDNAIQSRLLINTLDAMYLYYPEDFIFLMRYGEEPIRMKAFVLDKEAGEKHEQR